MKEGRFYRLYDMNGKDEKSILNFSSKPEGE